MEFLHRTNLNILPQQLKNYLYLENIEEIRKTKVDYLDESPYVKFKPNTIITSQGRWRGSEDQFVYDWTTDRNGFKNLEKISKLNKVDIVALGNSFTEGMGIATEKVWPSLLTSQGFNTYNLGVQGYAPIQLLGSFKKYGLQLKPEYVIIGYTLGTFVRENLFFDERKVIEERNFAGGIQNIIETEEIREQARYIPSALWLMTNSLRINLKKNINNLSYFNTILSDQKFNSYKRQVLSIEKNIISESKLSNSNEWKSTLDAFKSIIDLSHSINAKVILLPFSTRGVIYFERATGKKLPKSYSQQTELKLLQEFADKNEILFVNSNDALVKYVDGLENNFDIKLLPYLKIDGHMSNIGHELISKEIMKTINK